MSAVLRTYGFIRGGSIARAGAPGRSSRIRARERSVTFVLYFAALGVECRIALQRLFATTSLNMSDGAHLTTWVPRETKERFAAVARQQGLSDSALLKRMIDLALQSANAVSGASVVTAGESVSRAARLTVRLRADD